MRIGSLFAGIGGFDLAARWVGWETAWYSEIDPYASAVMRKHFPRAVNHGDITQIDGRAVEPVDLLCGGFPCQDISLAGKGEGLRGARSGLWSHYARLIGEIRPAWVVIENVSALRSRGLDQVLGEIAALGYDAEWHCIPAAYVGAPHRRDRVWIVAHAVSERELQPGWLESYIRRRIGDGGCASGRQDVANADSDTRNEWRENNAVESARGRDVDRSRVGEDVLHADRERSHAAAFAGVHRGEESAGARYGKPQRSDWWLTEPDVGRVANGVPARVDRLRALGNAIVPQVAYEIFKAIASVCVLRS